MNSKTRIKFNFLTRYVQRNFNRWKKKYSNIIGAHIGKKFRAGHYTNRYSIVFLVIKKLKRTKYQVPEYFMVKFPDGLKRKIMTDVFEIEEFNFRSVNLGDKTQRKDLTNFGSIGAVFEKNKHLYACTNMHVAFPDLIANHKTYFFRPINQQFERDIFLFNNNQFIEGFLEVGVFDKIDVSLIRVVDAEFQNLLPGIGFPSGFARINSFFIGMPLEMLGGVTGQSSGLIQAIGVSIPTSIPGIRIDNLVITSIASQSGDSGSPVYSADLKIAGIVIGGGTANTYILPIEAIQNSLGYNFKF